MKRARLPVEFRIWDKVHFRFSRGCWIWTGATDRWGNPKIWSQEGPVNPREVAFMSLVGPIQKGYRVIPICHNPCCLHPDHLRAFKNGYIPGEKMILSGYSGVFWHHHAGAWMGKLSFAGGSFIGMGPFADWDTAWETFCDTVAEIFGAHTLNETDSDFGEGCLVGYDPEVY